MSEQTFAKGFYFDDPHAKAPDFVIGKVSVKVQDAIAFLQQHQNNKGYVNLDIKRSREGKPYMALDTWQPSQQSQAQRPEAEPQKAYNDGLPF
jgi:hypothetical protein